MSILTNKQLKDRLRHLQIEISQYSFRTKEPLTMDAMENYLLKLIFLTEELASRIT